MPNKSEILQAYRQLYRHGLRAVQYASPARYTLRHQLNQAFRQGDIKDFDAQKIKNTILFLKCASKAKGLEHRILKTLLHVRWWDTQIRKQRQECVLAPGIGVGLPYMLDPLTSQVDKALGRVKTYLSGMLLCGISRLL